MKSLLTQLKAHKIISALAVVVIIIIAIVAGGGSKQTPPTNSKPPAKTTASTTDTTQEPKITYKVTEDKQTNVAVLVPASDDNATAMKQLGDTLKSVYSGRSHVFVYVFDDATAASYLDNVLNGSDTTAQDAIYDPHFVAEYQRNAPTNLNRFTIQLNGGDQDANPTTINY
jgi:hypothetical protein